MARSRGIVFITVAGSAQMAFANALHKKTNGGVSLVIVQKPKRLSFLRRFSRFYAVAGWRNFLKECRFGILLRFSPKTREALDYFHEHSFAPGADADFSPPVKEVASINGDETHKLLKKTSPKIIVIWGGAVLRPHILRTAERAINLHFGLAPHYRGAVANQFALLRGDTARIGATIHYAEEKVDAGAILATIAADAAKPPRELFCDLNDRAFARYLEIAAGLFWGEDLPATVQNISQGELFLLRDWNRETRYKLGKKMLKWERRALRDSA
jgi:hypothetical protein